MDRTAGSESTQAVHDVATGVGVTSDHAGEQIDGFHLVIDALKLNGINNIYGVPGIPITDLGRLAQAAGMRVISFRHEQHAGNAAAMLSTPQSPQPTGPTIARRRSASPAASPGRSSPALMLTNVPTSAAPPKMP